MFNPRQTGRDALVSLSLANLCWLRIWSALLTGDATQYFSGSPYGDRDYLAAVASFAGLTALFFGGAVLLRWYRRRWLRSLALFAFLAFMAPIFDFSRRELNLSYTVFLRFGPLALAAVGVVFLSCAYIWRQQLLRFTYGLLVFAVPLAFLDVARIGWLIGTTARPTPKTEMVPAILSDQPRQLARIVWIIFDEWDENAIFGEKEMAGKLPNLTAFARHALVVKNAYPPAGNTMISIPSLLRGKYLTDVRPESYGVLLTRAVGEPGLTDFSSSENLFSRFGGLGRSVAIAGWYHPYQSLVPAGSTARVHWEPIPELQGFRGDDFWKSMLAQATYVFAPFLAERACIDSFSRIDAFVSDAVRDPELKLGYFHYNIPHFPGIFNPGGRDLELRIESADRSYDDNLELVDLVLGRILSNLDASGLRATTTLILSSDHWRRDSPLVAGLRDHRVPFLVQLAGEHSDAVVDSHFNTVHTFELIQMIAAGAIKTQAEIEEFISRYPAGVEYSDFHFDARGYLRVDQRANSR